VKVLDETDRQPRDKRSFLSSGTISLSPADESLLTSSRVTLNLQTVTY